MNNGRLAELQRKKGKFAELNRRYAVLVGMSDAELGIYNSNQRGVLGSDPVHAGSQSSRILQGIAGRKLSYGERTAEDVYTAELFPGLRRNGKKPPALEGTVPLSAQGTGTNGYGNGSNGSVPAAVPAGYTGANGSGSNGSYQNGNGTPRTFYAGPDGVVCSSPRSALEACAGFRDRITGR